MHTYTGLDGDWFIVGEDVDSEGVSEFTVTLDEVDASAYSDVTVSILVGSGGQLKFDTSDHLLLEYDNNNSGTFTVLGAFYGYDFANGDGTNGNLYEDTDFGQEIVDAVDDQLAAMNMTLVESASAKPTDTDFTAQIKKLNNAGSVSYTHLTLPTKA